MSELTTQSSYSQDNKENFYPEFKRKTSFKDFKNLKKIVNIEDQYKVFGKLGEGGYAQVYKAQDLITGKICAVKEQVRDSTKSMSLTKEMVVNELQLLADLSHPNIMQVNRLLYNQEYYYIISEHLEGGELFDRIVEIQGFSEQDAAIIVKNTLLAINYLHQNNIVHRDLKPENILLVGQDASELDIKLIDFGVSCILDPNDGLDTIVGSAFYYSPEQCRGKNYTSKVDIWAMGIITYQILKADIPFAIHDERQDQLNVIKKWNPQDSIDKLQNYSFWCRDFLKCALDTNQKTRFTAKQLLGHPWLNDLHDSPLSQEDWNQISQNVEKFSKSSLFVKSVASILIFTALDQAEVKLLKHAFLEMDTNNDGLITIEDLQTAKKNHLIKYEQWTDFLQKLDLYGGCKVDFEEFLAAASDHRKLFSNENIQIAFNIFDVDNIGKIKISDFSKILPSSRDEKLLEHTLKYNKQNNDPFKRECQLKRLTMIHYTPEELQEQDQKWREILCDVDTTDDGYILYPEFKQALIKFIDQTQHQSIIDLINHFTLSEQNPFSPCKRERDHREGIEEFIEDKIAHQISINPQVSNFMKQIQSLQRKQQRQKLNVKIRALRKY